MRDAIKQGSAAVTDQHIAKQSLEQSEREKVARAVNNLADQKREADEATETNQQRRHGENLGVQWIIAIATALAFMAASIYAWEAHQQLIQMTNATEAALKGASTGEQALDTDMSHFDRTQSQMLAQTAAEIEAAKAAQSAAETAQKSLEVQNRPWLSAEVVPSDDPLNKGDLTFDRDGNLSIQFTVKGQNVGKSVAQDIHVYAKLFATRIGNPWVEVPKWQKEVCDHPKVTYVRPGIPFFPGFDLFPDQPYSRGVGTEITRDDVIRESSYYSDDPLRRRFIDRLYLVGCVDYRSSFTKERRQSRFVYDVLPKGDFTRRTPDGMPVMSFEVGTNLTKDQYWIAPSLSGGNYAY